MKHLLLCIALLLPGLYTTAQSRLADIEKLLAEAPVQEKVYLHLDNTSYFKGDTIWYKSYVVRADSLNYSDMSRIVYVELVSPDGLVVERQQLIASAEGYGDGNFALKDSLYSGYYELRAYTRWMLNFCVTEHPYTRTDSEQFYNRQMAKDFFRQFGTIYSRVVPVYERPDSLGDYSQKYIVSRPKTRLEKEQKEQLIVNFYPEGGHLIAGTRCTVAFEALSEEGEQIDISGTLEQGDVNIPIRTEHQGRGMFTIDAPEYGRMKARFNYRGKDYTFDLPKVEKRGCALHLDATHEKLVADVTLQGETSQDEVGVAVLCRGVLKSFQTIRGSQQITIDSSKLPTGVCDLLVLNSNGQPLADRLFFVNHHDVNMQPVTMNGMETEYEPFDSITIQFQAPAEARHLSISVRDGAYDEPTYDTGNIMTELLLSSDLKGFIAHPGYYFESDDVEHRQRLDLLMMVQGWRRYDYTELTRGQPLRYEPEKTMTVEGAVYKTVNFDELREGEIGYWLKGIFGWSDEDLETLDPDDPLYEKYQKALKEDSEEKDWERLTGDDAYKSRIGQQALTTLDGSMQLESIGELAQEFTPRSVEETEYGINHGGLNYEVTLKGELVLSDEVGDIEIETTNGGRFMFQVPPFYGEGILFLSAHKTNISERKQHRLETKGRLDEDAWPEFYVKRDLFFPIFARKYDYYQCHQSQEVLTPNSSLATSHSSLTERLSSMDRELSEVNVKARRRRGRYAIDYTKPAYVYDAYELYNLATDYGLSFGKLNFRRFPIQVSMLLLGNYNSNRFFNVEARMSDNLQTPYIFYRNYKPDDAINTTPFRSNYYVAKNLRMNRQNEIRLFTDFELRNEDKPKEQSVSTADVTLDFSLLPDDGLRYTYRDRRIILHGMYEPDDFYHPNYNQRPLPDTVKDYRRTLYWNPNARLDADGHFTARFFNNGKTTRIKVSTALVPFQ